MEFDDNNVQEEHDDNYVEIYSKRAIFWFSVFSPLFGGILLMLNLKAAGYKKAIYTILVFLILFALASNVLVNQFTLHYKVDFKVFNQNLVILFVISSVLNVGCALILSQYFFRKYFPDNDYYPKNIQTPLLIFISVMIFFMLVGYGL